VTNAGTGLFDWARDQGLSVEALAERLGYSARHLYRIQGGEQPVTDAFVGRVVLRLGEWARELFPDAVWKKTRRKQHDEWLERQPSAVQFVCLVLLLIVPRSWYRWPRVVVVTMLAEMRCAWCEREGLLAFMRWTDTSDGSRATASAHATARKCSTNWRPCMDRRAETLRWWWTAQSDREATEAVIALRKGGDNSTRQ
jgi:transcriptional regulator with XRE-family HTH domain